MMWCSLSEKITPNIPIADFSEQNIFEALETLAGTLDYTFGIRKGIPFFKPKDNFFKVTEEITIFNNPNSDSSSQYRDSIRSEDSLKHKFEKGKYYYINGEIILIDKTALTNEHLHVYRGLEKSIDFSNPGTTTDANYYQDFTGNANKVEYSHETDGSGQDEKPLIRLKKITTEVNVYEISSILNHKNIITIDEFSFLSINSYTDYTISYGNGKEIRRVLNDDSDFKNTLSIDIPLVEDPQWIKYLEKKINQNKENFVHLKLAL